MASAADATPDVDWATLDKGKFFLVGTGLFSGITTVLFPLSVVKTRMMALDAAPCGGEKQSRSVGLHATVRTARAVVSSEGLAGLYRGFPTVVTGFLPARLIYLSTLEFVKARTREALERNTTMNHANIVPLSSFISGACASLASQTIFVPVDVVSQQQMVASKEKRIRVVHRVQNIWRYEGFRGFYRGYWMSVALFVPGSAMWWGAYSLYKSKLWAMLASDRLGENASADDIHSPLMMGIQGASAVLAGCTTSTITTPLDVIKTRVQVVGETRAWSSTSSFLPAVKALVKSEGLGGLYRGLFPRMASSALWGSSMVLSYEFLKRNCVRKDIDAA
eukprot:CAMPEP_0198239054 /NCGR_PEP_ID=MMETSP1446-20131203/4577_1 /TAXON_ID=1461542 ORGANISM="Unidentified sp, Strain CCMP2111" /NCGR_SAMPLE_ID=MMETSP1446 /ASSEMBLY_ACC=CAM_ASM_001112 /LENGTH=334 /DNA_ID=CAMNT_0043921597 /DNA_START=476 /DNA_END=1480 /DNA_ORIENTATION=-